VELDPSSLNRCYSSINSSSSIVPDSVRRHFAHGTESSPEVISAIVEMKRRNPRFGYQRIADQIILVFDIEIDKDTVRRVLANHYRPRLCENSPDVIASEAKQSLSRCFH
jgi:hypothetical protein